MVDNVSFTGQYNKKSVLYFKHYNISSITIYVNGESLAAYPIKCNFDINYYLNLYLSLFATTGKFARDEGLDLFQEETIKMDTHCLFFIFHLLAVMEDIKS